MRYSVYVFLDPSGKPYYVGKTNNMVRRRREHLKEIETGSKLPKYEKARKLIKMGHKLKMKRVASFTKEDDAFAKERQLIRLYRKRSDINLTNLTTGGRNERPTDTKGRPRQADWYTPTKTVRKKKKISIKKPKRKTIARKISKKRRRR
jgi:predicted GIY-YIG superfamily endonuclease